MSARARLAALALVVLAAGAIAVLHEPVHAALEALLEAAAGLGPATPWVLGALWVPAALLLVPGSILTLGTGFLLGVPLGLLVVSLGSTAGAAAAFAAARWVLRDPVRARAAARPRLAAVDRAVAEGGVPVVLLLRLSPVLPYNLLNWTLGASGVAFGPYLLATWLGMLPGTLAYVWLGAGARSLAEAARGDAPGGQGPLGHALFALGLVATFAAAWVLARRARRALEAREALASPADPR